MINAVTPDSVASSNIDRNRDILSRKVSIPKERKDIPLSGLSLRAELHGTTLTHATSLRQAYDMTWDHLHVYDIFTYKIKYTKVCTGIYGAKKF